LNAAGLLFGGQQLKRLENCAHRDDGWLTVKSQLITIVTALLVVGSAFADSIYNK
jgi:hypothetical protein